MFMETEELITAYLERGILTLDEIAESGTTETVMKRILNKVHTSKISRLASGQYYTYVPDPSRPKGRRQVKRATAEELEQYLLEYYSKEHHEHGLTYADLYAEWMEHQKLFVNVDNPHRGMSPSTIRRYERDYDKYISDSLLAGLLIRDITPTRLEKELVTIVTEHQMTEKAAKNLLGYISMSFDYAERAEYVRRNPFRLVERKLILARTVYVPPKDDSERILTLSELSALRKAVLQHELRFPKYAPDYAIELAMMTGMRIGEIAALRWECIDENCIHIDYAERRYDYKDRVADIVIGEPKNRKHRKIPLTPEMRKLFHRIQIQQIADSEYVFVQEKTGERYSAHDIGSAVSRRAKEAGIGSTSIHEIRRTVSSMLRTTLPVSAVAHLLGHQEATNEQHYNYDTLENSEKADALASMSAQIQRFSVAG